VVVTSSGTAVANLLPVVVEASQAAIPLLLLTADRPGELQRCGANQTIDQVAQSNNRRSCLSSVS
jgi:2-succinyl-5-enolpyruvyl-6-hydroxy-3-cyclohexene-1-carboxylate synthase